MTSKLSAEDRAALLAWCKKQCNNPCLKDEGDFAYVLDQVAKEFQRMNIKSQSLSDMTTTYTNDTNNSTIRNLLMPYSRIKFL